MSFFKFLRRRSDSDEAVSFIEEPYDRPSNSPDEFEEMALQVQQKCQIAGMSARALRENTNDEYERTRYLALRDEVVVLIIQLHDEFLQGFAIHQLGKLCRDADDIDYFLPFFSSVTDEFIREKICEDLPELARFSEADAK